MSAELMKPSSGYREYLIAFLDVLGLRAAIKATASGEGTELIAEALGTVRTISQTINVAVSKKKQKLNFNSYVFSDTIVITSPEVSKHSFSTMMQIVSAIQFEMCNHFFFLRGAITAGQHFEREGVLFGPAFARAYEMEQYANWPRVVVDPGISKIVGYKPTPMYQAEVITDQMGWGYLNYLKITFERDCCDQLKLYKKQAITDIDYSRVMRLHKMAITSRVKDLPLDTPLNIITKYHALADYHNKVLNSLIALSVFLEHRHERPDPEVAVRMFLANSRLFGNRPDSTHIRYPSSSINKSIRQASGGIDSFRECEIDLVSTFKQIYTL